MPTLKSALLCVLLPMAAAAAEPREVRVEKDLPYLGLEESKILAAALAKVGHPHELVIVEGGPHSFHLQPKQRDLRPVVLGFFDKYLKPR